MISSFAVTGPGLGPALGQVDTARPAKEAAAQRPVSAADGVSTCRAGTAEAKEEVMLQDAIMATDLIDQARSGDGQAFRQLVEPYQRELQVHCYRILGSAQDAEDALQETLLAAWRSLGGFERRSSLRTWLYRIATSRWLNALRSAKLPPRRREVVGLEPYPDLLLADLPDDAPGPQARYEAREAISLAFITALQLLPPQQRAALILRDVLGFRTGEAAEILQASEQSVASALKRARATVAQHPSAAQRQAPPPPHSPAEQDLVHRLTRAFEAADVTGIVALLTEDAWLTMPPLPLES